MERQERLREQRTRIWALMSSAALHMRVGGMGVMDERLQALRAAADRSEVTLQVHPQDGPLHALAGTPALTFYRVQVPGIPDHIVREGGATRNRRRLGRGRDRDGLPQTPTAPANLSPRCSAKPAQARQPRHSAQRPPAHRSQNPGTETPLTHSSAPQLRPRATCSLVPARRATTALRAEREPLPAVGICTS
jgi:hypothetical protein